ncbi:MAG TPA: phosphoribosylanthranilate isomerase [Candidatus Eisenbacteria bacterium]
MDPAGPVRTVVKVCGLTRLEDARVAREAGADWLGFVLKGDTPRCIEPEQAARIAGELPGATAVAVLVSPAPEEALDLARRARAQRVQLHRVDPLKWPESFPLPVVFAVPVAGDGSLEESLPPVRHLVLLDTAHRTLAGGTGERFPWETARVVAATRDVLLAGGLDADRVVAALETVRPFGVDASSRLETAPGLKDPEKVRRFVAAVRRWEQRQDDRT